MAAQFDTIPTVTGAPKPGPAMNLRQAIEKYLAVAGEYGKPAALSAFGLSTAETETVFGLFDEDYQLSRFFHLRNESGESYQINGFPQTHVVIDADIKTIL